MKVVLVIVGLVFKSVTVEMFFLGGGLCYIVVFLDVFFFCFYCECGAC